MNIDEESRRPIFGTLSIILAGVPWGGVELKIKGKNIQFNIQ